MEWIIRIASFLIGFCYCLYLLRNRVPSYCITKEEHLLEMKFKNKEIKHLKANQKQYGFLDEKWSDGIFPKD